MGRDFAKKGRHKGSTHAAPASSHWVWLLAGTAIGIVISTIVFFKLMPTQFPHFAQLKQATEKSAPTTEKKPEPTPHFDFYSLLPELEVSVPEEETPAVPAQTTAVEPEDSPINDVQAGYRLQLASFRHYKDADSLKAQMALLGIQVEIEAVNLAPNDTWYRVRSLPYPSRESAEAVRAQLQTQAIQSLLLEGKG